ncbi:type IVB secretion system protein IcmH/DotU [Campylobacter sp. US33a]|uniref:Type IVB secretion system protein IcmH/DotU n=1 Tax=Campylobacter sp. CCS1377 TaxID=3158229 RepID=A0AAU7E9N0_9BACT|nr:type IVB secretion system protein IcmH/DotU [Campylobacter sp. US33a]MCW1360954.1 type IVB secretion system protein IcmH/DotU [Campylobacter jejuni]TEY00216.1 DotU family type IV/VI secretion system protein [Campylobacter sp. US33a]
MQENISKNKEELSLILNSKLEGLKNNKIIDYSLELLLLSYRLSKITSLETHFVANLRETLINSILAISAKLSACKEYEEKDIIKFRYCLCVFIDESLMKNENFIDFWANNTLTVRLFDETLGGNNFYDIALSWLNNPAKNKDFLEFIYTCLILGYKGKYSDNKDCEERIIHLCNNIATSLASLYTLEEQLAFNKAYEISFKENAWQKFMRLYFNKLIIILPLIFILTIFSYSIFNLETNNKRIENNVSKLVQQLKSVDK